MGVWWPIVVGGVCEVLFLLITLVKCDSYGCLSVIPSRAAASRSACTSGSTIESCLCSYCTCLPRYGVSDNDLSRVANSRIVATFRRRAFTNFPGKGCSTTAPMVSC